MATITIRDLDEGLNRRLRVQADQHGRSMEEEVRDILSRALGPAPAHPERLGSAIHALFNAHGGVELEAFPREPIREPPSFE